MIEGVLLDVTTYALDGLLTVSSLIYANSFAANPMQSISSAEVLNSSNPKRNLGTVDVRVLDSFEVATERWATLAAGGLPSPYQQMSFLQTWFETLGRAQGWSPFLVLAESPNGEPEALLPFGLRRLGPVRVIAFLGGKDVNANLGIFRDPAAWTVEAVQALLRTAARGQADLVWLENMPERWIGEVNSLAAINPLPAPSPNFATRLQKDFDSWFNERLSKESRKKWRKKRQGLEKLGAVSAQRAETASEAEAFLAAFLLQRAQRAQDGLPNAYESAPAVAFIRRLAGLDAAGFAPALTLWALKCGDAVIATFGAFVHRAHVSLFVTSFDSSEAFARCSPGELLLHDIVRAYGEAGLTSLDLGIGDGRYKRETCEDEIALVNVALPITWRGAVFAWGLRRRSQAKGFLKASPWASAALRRLRGFAARRAAS